MPFELERLESDQNGDDHGQSHASQHGKADREAQRGAQIGGRVRAQPIEAGVSKGNLPGMSDQEAQAHGVHGMQTTQDEDGQIVIVGQEGRGQHECPEKGRQPDHVLAI